MTEDQRTYSRIRLGLLLWFGGMIGAASLLPVLPRLLENLSSMSGQELPLPMYAIQAISLVQTGVFLALAVTAGVFLAPRVGLSAPAAEALVSRRNTWKALRRQILPGIVGGIAGGLAISLFGAIMLPYLPPEFIVAGKNLAIPVPVRLLYGGFTEELLLRWGLMTLLVWLPYRFIRRGQGEVAVHYYWAAIIISALIFGLGHLPAASLLSPTITSALIAYIVIANSLFGLVAGYIYWRRGLESAILAHMLAHVVMVTAENLIA
jgi:membrane protease YdiL (CAAX protease family)